VSSSNSSRNGNTPRKPAVFAPKQPKVTFSKTSKKPCGCPYGPNHHRLETCSHYQNCSGSTAKSPRAAQKTKNREPKSALKKPTFKSSNRGVSGARAYSSLGGAPSAEDSDVDDMYNSEYASEVSADEDWSDLESNSDEKPRSRSQRGRGRGRRGGK
jgi:hypothetical protein